VELLQRYSKSPSAVSVLRKALRVAKSGEDSPTVVVPQPYRPRRVRQRLGEKMVQTIIAAYAGGKTTPDLVAIYGISKTSLLSMLHEQGLARRKPGLSAEQIVEASARRANGESYDVIGRRFGVFGSTVWRALNLASRHSQSR
jgi:hypothetical protein